MSEFEIAVFASVICGILTIIFSIIAFICALNEGATKSTILSAFATILSAFFSFSSYANITVPTPTILPLNNETETYIDSVEVTVKSDKYIFLKTYYTLNGEDPQENGDIYEDAINISESTTVSARNNFLFLWSGVEQRSYKFIENNNVQNIPLIDERNGIEDDIVPSKENSNEITEPLGEFPFYSEHNVIYPETKVIKIPTPEEAGTYSVEFPIDLQAEEYQSDKVPTNSDIHGFVVNALYYCSDDDSVTDISGYNYYKFADYWLYLHTVDISFIDFDGFELMFNGATIVLQEKGTQKRIVLQEDYLNGDFVQFKCSTGHYIIEIQKGGIAYTANLNISKNEKKFLALTPDDYYYISPNDKDSYIVFEDNDKESINDNEKNISQSETKSIPESVLSTIYEDDVQLLIDDGKYIEAADLYKSKISKPTPEDWCNVGDILNYYIEDYDQAALYYSICLENDPTYEKASEGLKYAYEHGGSLDKYE